MQNITINNNTSSSLLMINGIEMRDESRSPQFHLWVVQKEISADELFRLGAMLGGLPSFEGQGKGAGRILVPRR